MKKLSLKVTLAYLIAASFWIVTTDILVIKLFLDSKDFPTVEIYKGLFFVITTGLMLFFMIQYYTEKIETMKNALLFSEDSLRLLAENAEDIIFRYLFYPTLTLQFISPAVERILGYKAKECYAYPELLYERIHPEDQEQFKKYIEHPNHKTHYYRCKNREDKWIWLSLRAVPLRDAQGKTIGVEGIVRDVTERIYCNDQLRKLSEAVRQSSNTLLITDQQGTIEYANDQCFQLTGYDSHEVIGNNPKIFQSGETPEEQYREMWKTIRSGQDWSGEILNKKKDGTLYWEEVLVTPIKNDRGVTTHFLGVKHDITERKEQERIIVEQNEALKLHAQHLEKLNEKLLQTEQLKNEFLSNISHELRTPLNAVIGFSQLIKDGEFEDSQQLVEFVDIIEKNGQELLTIITNILTLAKMESGTESFEKALVDVELLMDALHNYVESQPIQKGLTVVVEPQVEKLRLETDYEKVLRVLMHVLQNAIKFTSSGTITIKAEKRDNHIAFVITDTGIGIEPEEQKRLFQKFVQVDGTASRRYSGLGMGLALCQLTIHKLEGTIELYSEGKNKGTEVTIYLPLYQSDSA
ncbi:sensor histidine kinase [Heliorestis convoluta]|uniref:histidine kinase n=1 Tax=Heliorestis convoluta TaxID=356322 RepID=A0A5Q2N2V4_9FIRM|nr:PAS domain-containing sensor histidine kinase [Heliorestis convoluta]QGG47612.1 PAS/PAC sensor hybrid histidine kinase [Heliorestis convoluta]